MVAIMIDSLEVHHRTTNAVLQVMEAIGIDHVTGEEVHPLIVLHMTVCLTIVHPMIDHHTIVHPMIVRHMIVRHTIVVVVLRRIEETTDEVHPVTEDHHAGDHLSDTNCFVYMHVIYVWDGAIINSLNIATM